MCNAIRDQLNVSLGDLYFKKKLLPQRVTPNRNLTIIIFFRAMPVNSAGTRYRIIIYFNIYNLNDYNKCDKCHKCDLFY